MKKFSLFALPLAMLLMPIAVPQQSSLGVDRPLEQNLVFDDDGRKVQIVPADLSIAGEKKFHGGQVMASVRQVSIFLGGGWSNPQARLREPGLSDVAAIPAVHLLELGRHNIQALPAAPPQEDFSNLGPAPVNDLTIQRKLAEMVASKAVPAPAATTLYVVFLAPGVTSTVGGHKAGLEYAAYHNSVKLGAGEVHYAVVPFHENSDRHAAAAARVLAEAALNPDGTGWF